VARLQPGPQHLAAHAALAAPAGRRPALPDLVEQQAGARLPRGGLEHVLLGLPVAAPGGPAEAADPRLAQDVADGGSRR
jgi:hypothetical protein